jgi:predicted kinase
MATVHLISGLPCSGKTTYASALAVDTRGVHFQLDYWLITAFGRYSIDVVGHEEHVRRVLACRELIWKSASEFVARGVDVILDDGFFFGENRRQHIVLAGQAGARAKTHYMRASVEVLRERLTKRNESLPPYNFRIEPAMLDLFVGLFEIPSRKEGAELVVIESGGEARQRPV